MALGTLLVLVLVVAAIGYLSSNGEVSNRSRMTEEGRYIFNEQIVKEVTASTSDAVPATNEVASLLLERGFESTIITSGYDQSGNPSEEVQLDPASKEKHPLYNVYYISPSGNAWVIYVCNGAFMANPLFLYDPSAPGYILAEDDYVTSYSSVEDKFIQSIPAESELVLKKVDEINAATLDLLDENGIEDL